jgi:hypothetical protein
VAARQRRPIFDKQLLHPFHFFQAARVSGGLTARLRIPWLLAA